MKHGQWKIFVPYKKKRSFRRALTGGLQIAGAALCRVPMVALIQTAFQVDPLGSTGKSLAGWPSGIYIYIKYIPGIYGIYIYRYRWVFLKKMGRFGSKWSTAMSCFMNSEHVRIDERENSRRHHKSHKKTPTWMVFHGFQLRMLQISPLGDFTGGPSVPQFTKGPTTGG